MRNSNKNDPNVQKRIQPPAKTPEAREDQMIALAMDQAERQLRAGTASSQVITHFLKMGSMKEEIERETLQLQKELIKAKTEAIQSAKRVEDLYLDALSAMRTYAGGKREDVDD